MQFSLYLERFITNSSTLVKTGERIDAVHMHGNIVLVVRQIIHEFGTKNIALSVDLTLNRITESD